MTEKKENTKVNLVLKNYEKADLNIPGGSHPPIVKGRPIWTDYIWHASALKCYQTCPKQFYLKYIKSRIAEKYKAGLIRGRACHEAIKLIKWHDLWDAPKEVAMQIFEDELDSDLGANLDEGEEEKIPKLREETEIIVTNWAKREKEHNSRVIFTEVPFEFDFKGLKFGGTIDEVRDEDKGPGFRDYKSNLNPPGRVCLLNDVQFMIYGLAMKYGTFHTPTGTVQLLKSPSKAIWYQLNYLIPYKRKTTKKGVVYLKGDMKGDPNIPVDWKDFNHVASYTDVRQIIGSIKGNNFYKRSSALGSCEGFCPHTAACLNEPVPGSEKPIDTDLSDLLV